MRTDTKLFLPSTLVGLNTLLPLAENINLMLVWCPPDHFRMSNNKGFDHHQVILRQGFWISRTLITQALWQYVMTDDPDTFGTTQNEAELPVEGITWDSAQQFCQKLTPIFRAQGFLSSTQKMALPTEAQWEYACRAGTQSKWDFGDDESKLKDYAWYQANSEEQAHPVALKKPNLWGIYDLYGNVAEWCLDSYSKIDHHQQERIDPCVLTDSKLKVVRGGAYTHLARECQSGSREAILQHNPFSEPVGIRVVCVSVQ